MDKDSSAVYKRDASDQDQATLLMLSGGPCSLSVLIDLLKNTKQTIFAHHVECRAVDHDAGCRP